MRIVVVGLRGFPNIQGGIETHCEELYPRIVDKDHEVVVVRRKQFVKENPVRTTYNGVIFKDISAPSIIGLEAAIHTLKGIWFAKKVHADIVHVHAIGPSIAIPIAKILGLKVVMTHHGPDYEREKWGLFARFILKLGERFAAWWADDIISISTVISDILKKKYNRTKHVHLIYNGITNFPISNSTNYINSLGLQSEKYILAVGRFVEEKRFDKLIEAYVLLNNPEYKLVIAGDADNETAYSKYLKDLATKHHIILTGMIKGKKLQELYSHAALFVLPSSHEGLPITLLEAMSMNRKVLASNISSNLVIGLPQKNYFELNSIPNMVNHIKELLNIPQSVQEYNLSPYNWTNIASQIKNVYDVFL